jgi:hypothetical protein
MLQQHQQRSSSTRTATAGQTQHKHNSSTNVHPRFGGRVRPAHARIEAAQPQTHTKGDGAAPHTAPAVPPTRHRVSLRMFDTPRHAHHT